MTEKKPAGMSFQGFAEQQIQAAMRRGEFDGLKGLGKPIPDLDKPHDENWWLRQMLEREDLDVTPAVFELRREVEKLYERLKRHPHERSVERAVDQLNDRILEANRTQTGGPGSDLMPLRHADVLARWRIARARAES